MHLFTAPRLAYEVEFIDESGTTRMVTLALDQLTPARRQATTRLDTPAGGGIRQPPCSNDDARQVQIGAADIAQASRAEEPVPDHRLRSVGVALEDTGTSAASVSTPAVGDIPSVSRVAEGWPSAVAVRHARKKMIADGVASGVIHLALTAALAVPVVFLGSTGTPYITAYRRIALVGAVGLLVTCVGAASVSLVGCAALTGGRVNPARLTAMIAVARVWRWTAVVWACVIAAVTVVVASAEDVDEPLTLILLGATATAVVLASCVSTVRTAARRLRPLTPWRSG